MEFVSLVQITLQEACDSVLHAVASRDCKVVG
jgi:hypothetical protein